MQIINLKDKNIIITGAASGIGKETAITASRLGANVIMLDLSEDGLKETTYLLDGNNHNNCLPRIDGFVFRLYCDNFC